MTKASTATRTESPQAQVAENAGNLTVYTERSRLPYYQNFQERFGVDQGAWDALINSCYPSAKTVAAIVMVLDYCKARNLDPFKKPVHIVPMYVRGDRGDAAGKGKTAGRYVDTVWPGIAEIRTTAHRTHDYAGIDAADYGPEKTFTWKGTYEDEQRDVHERVIEITAPEWMSYTVYRMVAGVKQKFVGPRVYWKEAYATVGKSDLPNDMWQTRPAGQLDKCAEAAAIRRAFPEEAGNAYAAEEMMGRTITGDVASIAGVEIPVTLEVSAEARPTIAAPTNGAAGPAAVAEQPKPAPKKRPSPPPAPAAPAAQSEDRGRGTLPADVTEAGPSVASTPTAPAVKVAEEAPELKSAGDVAFDNYVNDFATVQTLPALQAVRQDVVDDKDLTDEHRIRLRDDYAKARTRLGSPVREHAAAPPAAAPAPSPATPGVKDGKVVDQDAYYKWAKLELERRVNDPDELAAFWTERMEPYAGPKDGFFYGALVQLYQFFAPK